MARLQLRPALKHHAHRQDEISAISSGSTSSRDIFDYWNLTGDLSPAPPYGLVDSGGFDYWNLAGEFPPVESKA